MVYQISLKYIKGLKYYGFTSGYTNIGIKKFEFVAKI